METIKAIAKRRSVRNYTSGQIPKEILRDILASGCAAPVGGGMYDTLHLAIIQDQTILDQLTEVCANLLPDVAKEMIKQLMNGKIDPLYRAPTVVIISSTKPSAPGMDYVNAGCIAENMMLAAVDAGIGSVVLGSAGGAVESDTELKTTLSIPDGYIALLGIAFGYPSENTPAVKDLKITINTSYV